MPANTVYDKRIAQIDARLAVLAALTQPLQLERAALLEDRDALGDPAVPFTPASPEMLPVLQAAQAAVDATVPGSPEHSAAIEERDRCYTMAKLYELSSA